MAAENAYRYDFGFAPEFEQPIPYEQPEKKPELKKLKKRKLSAVEYERISGKKIAKAAVFAASAVVMFSIVVNSFSAVTTSRYALSRAQDELKIYKSENVYLENELSKLVNSENIDKIAVQRLGLVKVSDTNKTYIDISEDNHVIYAQVED